MRDKWHTFQLAPRPDRRVPQRLALGFVLSRRLGRRVLQGLASGFVLGLGLRG